MVAEKREKLGDEAFFETVRRIALYTTDTLWMEHLEAMDYLRSSVNLRAYGQPRADCGIQKEGLMMFREMEQVFKEQVLSLIQTINIENIKNTETNRNRKNSGEKRQFDSQSQRIFRIFGRVRQS